jgi:hypothetical protein
MNTDSESANLASENSGNAIVLRRSNEDIRPHGDSCQHEVSNGAAVGHSGTVRGQILNLTISMLAAVLLALAGLSLMKLVGAAMFLEVFVPR